MSDLSPDLATIRARLAAATPGPWHGPHDDEYGCVAMGDYGWVAPGAPLYDVDSPQGQADAELIAHAPADLAALLAEVERLRGELANANCVIAAVRRLHAPEEYSINPIITPPTRHHGCFTCRSDGPCPTLLVMDGPLSPPIEDIEEMGLTRE